MAQHTNMAARHARSGARPTNARRKSRYVPALDGLRSFAVLAVLAYHMGLGCAPGGLMGVTVFFVISGYLINGLLVSERESTGTIDLVAFWLRRVRRLFPAILLCVVGTAALCTLFDHVLLDKMRPDIAPSLLFYNNWWQIFRDMSYFEAAGSPSPLTHFWSLSIEEQFYVVWPLVLLALYRVDAKKQTMSRIVLALAVLSALEMALLYDPAGDPSRIYYGTDTRALSLLVGVWLAFMWPSAAFGSEPRADSRDRSTWLAFNIAGAVALVGLFAIVAFTNGYSAFPYYGGIALTTVLSAVLIAALAVPRTWVARLFELRPLVWIGKRSYGMYLWHFPILLLTTDPNSIVEVPWWMRIVQLALIFGVSALSYTFIENPIRRGDLKDLLGNWREKATLVPLGCFGALTAIALIGVAIVPPTDYAGQYAGTESASEAESETENATEGGSEAGLQDSGSADFDVVFKTQRYNDAGQPIYEPLLIGDSVAASTESQFYEAFPCGHIDAVVNRNIWESPYSDYYEADQVGDYVVFCLGTNNAVVDWQIDDDLLYWVEDDKKVFMVNTRNTREWLESTNAAIESAGERHDNITVIDWYGASEGHDEYFNGDGTHLTETGAQAYIALIRDSIAATM